MSYASPQRAISLALLAVLWSVLLMTAIKVSVGWATYSLGLLAASLHTLLCAFSTLLSLQGLRYHTRQQHRPMGHGRVETASIFLWWALLGFGGFSLGGLAMQRVGIPGGQSLIPRLPLPLIQVLVVLVIASICFCLFERSGAKLLNQPLLRQNSQLLLQDGLLTLGVVAGMLGMQQGYPWLDLVMLGIVLPWVGWRSWQLLGAQLPSLVSPEAIAPEALVARLREVEGVLDCTPLRSRGLVGRQVFVELQVILHPEYRSLASSLLRRIESLLHYHYGPVQTTIYLAERDSDGQVKVTHSLRISEEVLVDEPWGA